MLWTLPRKSGLEKLHNGRYKVLPRSGNQVDVGFQIVFGSLADDVADNIVLIGQKELLTDRFILSLGSGKNEPIDKLLNDVDIATEVLGGRRFRICSS